MSECVHYSIYMEDAKLKNVFFHELETLKDTWTCFKDKPHKQIYTKKEEGSPVFSIFYKFQLPSNILKPYGLISNIEHMKDWMPDIQSSDVLKNVSNYHRAIHVKRSMPFPISNREVIVAASQVIVPERKGAMIIIRSVNQERQKSW